MVEKILSKLNELTKLAETLSNDTSQNNRVVSDSFMNLAECHFSIGNYKAAGYYYEQAFKFRRYYILDRDNAKCCILAGISHYRTGNVIQAERFFGYAVPAAKQANSQYYYCVSTSNMALVQLVQGRATKALEMANDSLEVAKQIFSLNSPEYLEFVRMTVNILIQSNQFEAADSLIQESEFSYDERAILRAGISSIIQDYDKAINYLKEAENHHHEVVVAQQLLASKGSENEINKTETIDSTLQNESIIQETKIQELQEDLDTLKLDNGKKKDFSYRQLMARCLVEFNLSILYSYKSNYELEKLYLEKACDGMVLVLSRVINETNQTYLLQSQPSTLPKKDLVLPTLDYVLTAHILHSHVMLSKLVQKLTYTPLLPSIKLQSGNSLKETDDEYPELVQLISDLNSHFLLWEQNVLISNMTQIENIQKTNPVTVISLKNSTNTNTNDNQIPIPTTISNIINPNSPSSISTNDNNFTFDNNQNIPSSDDYNDTSNVDTLIAQQLVANVAIFTGYSTNGILPNIIDPNNNVLVRSTSIIDPSTSTAGTGTGAGTGAGTGSNNSPPSSPRNKKSSNKKKDKVTDKKDVTKKKKKLQQSATKTKSQTNVPTHGSIKIEMSPQCQLAKVEGLSEYDKIIANALYAANGCGYGFLNCSGFKTDSNNIQINSDNTEQYSNEYIEKLTNYKKQLIETETTLLPIYDDLNQLPLYMTSNQHRNIHGTILSLYFTLCQLCFQLNHRKDTNTFIEKYINYCQTNLRGNLHYLAIGYRMQLDYEEWITGTTMSSMISQHKLKRYQEILLIAKKYYNTAEQIKDLDYELYYDSWKRIINIFTDISAVPDTPGTPKPPSTETLLENLSMLTQDEIDQFEETDILWLKVYSRIRAKSYASKLTIAVRETMYEMTKSDEVEGSPRIDSQS